MSHDDATESGARIIDGREDGGHEAEYTEESPAEAGATRSKQDPAVEAGESPEKETSAAIIERNRRNARLSTGPRSRAGKERARWNALKHGLLVREVIIPAGQGKENREHLMAILTLFRHGLDIQGVAEELLVERLAVIYWKMRRSEIGEVGELRLSLDTIRDRVLTEWMDDLENRDTDIRAPFKRHWHHVTADLNVIDELEQIIRDRGFLDEDDFMRLAKDTRTPAAKHLMLQIRGDADGTRLKPARRKEILEQIAGLHEYLERTRDIAGENGMTEMAMRADAETARYHMPEGPRAGFIQRRESSFDMQFHRALRTLERLQRARGGGAIRWAAIAEEEDELAEAIESLRAGDENEI